MKSILMSIRKPIADTIFKTWTKRLEYRTRFNKDFKGRVYVYESGKDGGKVAGFFDVERVIYARHDAAPTPEDWNILDGLDQKNFDEFFMIKAHAKPSVYAIEIKNVHRYYTQRTLKDFFEFYKPDMKTEVNRPPQSWQYIEIKGHAIDYPYALVDKVMPATPTEGESPTEEFMKERLKNE